MNKLIAVLALSSALMAAADAPSATASSNSGKPTTSPRSRCLTLTSKVLNADLQACQNKKEAKWATCKQNAYTKAKNARAACPLNRTKSNSLN